DLSAAPHAGGEGPGARSHQLLRPTRLDPAVAADLDGRAREGMEAEPRRPAEARRPLRVHPVRLLLDLVPELLVEPGPLSRPRRAAAGASLAQGLARRGDRGAASPPRGSVPALPLPPDQELRQGLPEGPQSREGDRRDQADADRAAGVALLPLAHAVVPLPRLRGRVGRGAACSALVA